MLEEFIPTHLPRDRDSQRFTQSPSPETLNGHCHSQIVLIHGEKEAFVVLTVHPIYICSNTWCDDRSLCAFECPLTHPPPANYPPYGCIVQAGLVTLVKNRAPTGVSFSTAKPV